LDSTPIGCMEAFAIAAPSPGDASWYDAPCSSTDIFRTDRDREDFLNRLAVVVEEEDLRLFAFVLIAALHAASDHMVQAVQDIDTGTARHTPSHDSRRSMTGNDVAAAQTIGDREGRNQLAN
jgi:hypothetical protein